MQTVFKVILKKSAQPDIKSNTKNEIELQLHCYQ